MIDYDETVLVDGKEYYLHQHFLATPGYPERCANCCNDYQDHNNRRCPVEDE